MTDARHGYKGFVTRHLNRIFGATRSSDGVTARTREAIETALQLRVLTLIERTPKAFSNPYAPQLVTLLDPHSRASEAYQTLRRRVNHQAGNQAIHTLLVTGLQHTRSRAVVAANLAVVMAQAGQRVVLLDADVRHPQVRRLFAQHGGAGLLTVLRDQENVWVKALVVTGVKNLMTVVAEPAEETASDSTASDSPALLNSPQMRAFMRHLREVSDVIVINAPAPPAPEGRGLAIQADWALLVLEHGLAVEQAACQAVDRLREAGTPLLGAVLAEVPVRG